MLPLAPTDEQDAAILAHKLGLPLLCAGTSPLDCDSFTVVLVVNGARRALQRTGKNAPGAVAVDFGAPAMRHRRRSGGNELLGRAVGVGKKPELRVLDATAGLGRDAFVLADLGCHVTLCERHPVTAQLLHAGLATALCDDDPWLQGVAQRMQVFEGDAREIALPPSGVDVIYLDPMFAPRAKTAAAGKEMALLQLLLQDDAASDSSLLLDWAMSRAVARVVVKRPLKAAHLGTSTPSHCLRGKAVRYDVYVRKSLQQR